MINSQEARTSSFSRICSSMGLRRPQREALQFFHKIFQRLSPPLCEATHTNLVNLFRDECPRWEFSAGFPEIYFNIATGVGKTRLIGALIAYFYLSRDSSHFLIVTPRGEIVRKFIREFRPDNSKYIFVDPTLINSPVIMHADNAELNEQIQFEPEDPVIWILTPQSITVKGAKLKRADEYTGTSPIAFLKSIKDLVIFFDESHHLGSKKEDPSVWRKELRKFEPKFLFGTSASMDLSEQPNVLYNYDLKACLNDNLYTKTVRVIAEKKKEGMDDSEHDHMVLRYAINRLNLKQKHLDSIAERRGLPTVPDTDQLHTNHMVTTPPLVSNFM